MTSPLPLGNLAAKINATGPIEDVNGGVLWELSQGVYPAKGKINIRNSQATIEQAIVNIGSGNLQLAGFANLNNWQITATANRIPLDALQPLEPLGIPPGLEGIANGQFRAAGPSSVTGETPALDAIAANGSATVDIAGGTASVTGQLNNGRWQANANLSELQLNELERLATKTGFIPRNSVDPIRNQVSLRNLVSGPTQRNRVSSGTIFSRGDGSLNLQSNFNGSLDNLTQINGNSKATIRTLGGNINANANINAGQIQATVETNKLALNPLIDLGISAVKEVTGETLREPADKLKSVEAELTSRVNISGNLANLSPNAIQANVKANLQIDEGAIATDATLNSGNFQANVDTTRLALSDVEEILQKTGLVPWGSVLFSRETDGQIEAKVRLSGNVNNLTPETVNLDADAKLKIANGNVNGSAQINSGQFQTSVTTSKIAVNSLLKIVENAINSEVLELDKNQVNIFKENLPIITALNSDFELTANGSGNLNNLTPTAINGNLDANLTIDEKIITANGSLNRGQFDLFLDTEKIAFSSLEKTLIKTLPDFQLTIPDDGDVEVNGKITGNIENLVFIGDRCQL